MLLLEQEVEVPAVRGNDGLLAHLSGAVSEQLSGDMVPVRFAVTQSDERTYHCELGVLAGVPDSGREPPASLFEFVPRESDNADQFNAVLLVPTGIGAEIGGHAGDAAPVARLLASVCDHLITHPNVVNASDINDIPENGLYVEGSVICRLLMGTVGLQKVRSNRVLVVIDAHQDDLFISAAVNSVSAARASCGLRCPVVVQLDPSVRLRARYTSSGSAAGRVEGLDGLCAVLDERQNQYDAVALASVIDVPSEFHREYFLSRGKMVNPWGGVEAILTHAVSSMFNVPSAHSPMLESRKVATLEPCNLSP